MNTPDARAGPPACPCRKCNGSGRVLVRREPCVVVPEPCPRCHGTRADPDPLDPDDEPDDEPEDDPTPTPAEARKVSIDTRTIHELLAAPFDVREVKFKPQIVKNNKALAIAYVDVRLVEDRLDEVLGIDNWQDDYEVLNDGSTVCRLRVNVNGQWVTKTDVGSPSEQPDSGDRLKAAFSDALKRTAVKFGIGRYLYRLPGQWVDFDPAKKQIVRPPQLPDFAVPKKSNLPATGAELADRLALKDEQLATAARCKKGELLKAVAKAGAAIGHPADLALWSGRAIGFAAEVVKEFERTHPTPNPGEARAPQAN